VVDVGDDGKIAGAFDGRSGQMAGAALLDWQPPTGKRQDAPLSLDRQRLNGDGSQVVQRAADLSRIALASSV